MKNLSFFNNVFMKESVKLKKGEDSLNYKNGKEILPEELLRQVQQYIQGDLIYIPIGETKRKAWGENNGTREQIKNRNEDILKQYKTGNSFEKLAALYCLSEESIRKIVYKTSKEYTKVGGR
ncbi:MAG TPA: CD3324 family protein [Clostridiaceae bacterium]